MSLIVLHIAGVPESLGNRQVNPTQREILRGKTFLEKAHAFLKNLLRPLVTCLNMNSDIVPARNHPEVQFSEVLGFQPHSDLPSALSTEIFNPGTHSEKSIRRQPVL